MIRTALISSLSLVLLLLPGCQKSPRATDPPDDGKTPETDNGKKPKDSEHATGNETRNADTHGGDEMDPTKKVCEAVTSEFPEAYFDDTLLIRLPLNVTIENFVEMAPGFVRLSGEVESVGCVPDTNGAIITYMAMGAFPEDPAKDMETWAAETLQAFGYEGASKSEESTANPKRYYQVVLDIPAGDKPEPARALFHMVAANGFMYAIVMEAHPDAWNALKRTFYSTVEQMKFLPPS